MAGQLFAMIDRRGVGAVRAVAFRTGATKLIGLFFAQDDGKGPMSPADRCVLLDAVKLIAACHIEL